jgi:hypothetical protein
VLDKYFGQAQNLRNVVPLPPALERGNPMETSLGFSQKISKFTDSVRQPLRKFAIAAITAVGVLLAFVSPGSARIVYTLANVTVNGNGSIAIDLNHDGIIDFTLDAVAISEKCSPFPVGGLRYSASVVVKPHKGDSTVVFGDTAAALSEGTSIDSSLSFYDAESLMASGLIESGPPPCRPEDWFAGFWCNGSESLVHVRCKAVDDYLGLQFSKEGKIYYGWAHVAISPMFVVTLTGYAYEDTAGMPITAGQTK